MKKIKHERAGQNISPHPHTVVFENMGWASPVHLRCCVFNTAILNHYIFLHGHETMVQARAVGRFLRPEIGTAPLNKVCFPSTTTWLRSTCSPPRTQSPVAESNWKKTGRLQPPHKPAVWRQVYMRPKERKQVPQHFGSSMAINRGMWSASRLGKQNKKQTGSTAEVRGF